MGYFGKKEKRGKAGRREWNGSASHEFGTSPAARPQANKRAKRAAGSGTIPAPSVSCIPPAGTRRAGNSHGRSCLPKFRIWGFLASFCLSVGSEHRAGRGVAEVKDLLWKSGKNPPNPIARGSKGVMLLRPPAPIPGRNLCPFPALHGVIPAPFPAPCKAFPSASAARASGRSLAPSQPNSHTWIH